MGLNSTQEWWVRTDGNNLNGGGFDNTISGAGINYSDQAASQLTLSDIVTNGTTTITSVTGGFTTQMIGNIIRIVGDDYYAITARTNTNTISVDRSTGTGSGQSASIGGAFSDLRNFANGGSATQPLLTTPVAPGHIIHLRGTGSLDGNVDYTQNGYYTYPAGDAPNSLSGGYITVEGYNGRPCIGSASDPLTTYATNYWRWVHIKWKALGATTHTHIFELCSMTFTDCLFDQNSNTAGFFRGTAGTTFNNHFFGCIFKDSGGGSSGGALYVLDIINSGGAQIATIKGCSFFKIIGGALHFYTTAAGNCVFKGNLVASTNSGSSASVLLTVGNVYNLEVTENTFDNNPFGDLDFSNTIDWGIGCVLNNIFSNGSGAGLTVPSGTALNDRIGLTFADYNNYFNKSPARSNISAGAHDLAVDPQYVNSSGGDFTPQNTALRGAAIPSAIAAVTNYQWLGAIQPQGASSSGGNFPQVFE